MAPTGTTSLDMPARHHDDWLEQWMFYTSESECPDSYLLWSGLHVISAAVQRKVWAPWVYHEFYPNIYVMLIGPPGVTHKNAAIRFTKQALKAVDVSISSDAISKEALISQMITRPAGNNNAIAVTSSEFATFIRTSGPPMVEFLTDIFDSEDNFEYTTKGGGQQTIPAPYLTMFTGATPGWMANEFDRTFIESGFASRTLFVAEMEPRFRKAFAHVTSAMKQAYQTLLEDLEVIRGVEGEFVWTESGKAWFTHWYEEELPKQSYDHRLAGYHGRKAVHLLKVAQLVRLNEGSTTGPQHLKLDEAVFKKGLKLLETLEPNMIRAFRTIGDNPYSTDLERIAADISMEKEIKASALYAMNIHVLEKQTIDQVIESLIAMGLITIEFRNGQRFFISTKD